MSKVHIIQIAENLSLPIEAVTQTLVVYGGKGMGKTNFGSVLVEELSRTRLRFSVGRAAEVGVDHPGKRDSSGGGVFRMIASNIPGWAVIDRPDSQDGNVHVIPVNDSKEHVADPSCECSPAQDDQVPDLWIHNAHDGREFAEIDPSVVRCDGKGCGKTVEIYSYDLGEMSRQLVARGWSVENGDYCPDCAKKREIKK